MSSGTFNGENSVPTLLHI